MGTQSLTDFASHLLRPFFGNGSCIALITDIHVGIPHKNSK